VTSDFEPTLDVGLAADLDSIVVTPSQRLGLFLTSLERGDKPLGESGGPASVRRVESRWEISWGDAGATPQTSVLDPKDTLWVSGLGKDAAASRLGWSGKTWRGFGKVFVGPRGRLTLALRLPLEIYLLGVVPGEIGGLSPALLQAGRAQAIAARSYTLFYRARRASEGFDLYGSVEDQVYGSIETERELATQCVTSTSGRVALHDGVPIRANYCSTCGGITADVWEAWPNDPMPYLLSHRDLGAGGDFCAASPHYRWREIWTAAEFLADVTRFAPAQGIPLPLTGLGELVDVAVESRSRSGRAWRLLVRGSTGELHVPAYSIRQVLRRGGNPNAILRSNLFKIDVLRDATGRATSVIASGAGSGHGVGLCQTGALGMARAGRSAEAILQHYYPGIDLRRLY
jgi:stage II sporulation protein D